MKSSRFSIGSSLLVVVALCAASYVLLVGTRPAHARYCKEVSVVSYFRDFEKKLRGCSVIIGSLKIVMDQARISDYQNLTFPELTEIRGYLLLYRVTGLTSLGKLFPNLAVVRGMNLITDYSIVLFEVPHLQEIGLKNLQYIARGSTRIEHCRNLCYVHSVDWKKIGGSLHELDAYDVNEYCKECPNKCDDGHCWSQDYCQVTRSDCHPECIGCDGPSADDCYACKSFRDNSTCVSQCPPGKFPHRVAGVCVTRNECPTFVDGTWWIFKNECVNTCPPLFQRVSAEEGWCKNCGNNCRKMCSGTQVDSITTAQELKGCTHINGSLSIRVDSKSTVNELEETLGMIEEVEGYVKIYRSHPLISLDFFKKLKVVKGNELENQRHSFIVFENQNLQKLWSDKDFQLEIKKGTLSFHGNPVLCLSEIEKLVKVTKLNNTYTNNDVSPYSNGDKTACNYIDLKITTVRLTSTNITLKWNNFVTESEDLVIGYVLYHIEDPLGNLTIYDDHDECDINGWDSIFVSTTWFQIVDLKPYTQYSYYIKTYTSHRTSSSGGQTHIKRFTTLADYPSVPGNLTAISKNSTSITLLWRPPRQPNGLLNHYNIVVYVEDDLESSVSERNFCEYPPSSKSSFDSFDFWSNQNNTSSNANFTADCCKKEASKKTPSVATFDVLCSSLVTPQEYSNRITFNSSRHVITKITADANSTQYVVSNLSYFAAYTFWLQACNHELCSLPAVTAQRTLRNPTADNVPFVPSVYVKLDDVYVKWTEPQNPNSMIVAYDIEYRRTDLEHWKTVKECVTQDEFVKQEREFLMKNLYPGSYELRVKAVSLAGPGDYTEHVSFSIATGNSSSLVIVTVVPCIILICVVVTITLYFFYRRKQKTDSFHLIADINPDYAGTIYVADEWEMHRNDLEIGKPLGQGTFGMVYSGVIKSQNRPCAVKTINENTNIQEKMVFLNEASVMKSFSSGHHVVKLLGVVSKGLPPYVVMELMGRGDLKTFLRKSRDSSTSITCAEMYRMSAEISDGMMYLAAKKFVHRDLAARNCMVAADHTVKIGDFGMTRDIYETDYYRKETRGLMPVRWMAPESLADGVFTSDSDVWSYGVVLWEIVTLAEQPYQGLANEQVLQFVIAQGTLERPPECPDLLYEIMNACWKWRPNQRPLFSSIVEKLETNVGQNFRLVSFYHDSEGEEYRMNAKNRVYNPPALTVQLNKNRAVHWNKSNDDVSLYSQESDDDSPNLLSSYQAESKLSSNSYR